ncbi:MAG: metalloregulator ArsR/SmtB family transcription factor [Candidatus Anstonellales archaeon]
MERESLNRVALLFKVLGSELRLNILLLLGKGPASVGKIVKHCGQEQSLVSHNLSMLRRLNMVHDLKKGRSRFYRVDPKMWKIVQEVIKPALLFGKNL